MHWMKHVASTFALLLAACSNSSQNPPAVSAGAALQTFSPLEGSTDHVGSAICGQCHQQASRDWKGSHHDLSMQPATPDTVLGDFNDTHFQYAGITTRFNREGHRHIVTTDGPDGQLASFEIRYTFGHYPLQQYLIELPGGRLQAFGIAWDSRPQSEGGQQWFHLYPDQNLRAGHPLHWTGRDQNWNFMCAECHSTDLKKNHDAASNSYQTTWAEIDVGCEACHGPGLAHAQWATSPDPKSRHADASKGLSVLYHERRGAAWQPIAETGNSVRNVPRTTQIEIDACGRCHGRASRLLGDAIHGRSLLDSHRPALLDPDQYWPDGQMLGEVFNWGPFLQSRMHQAGVTCSDCHQPHSLQLRAEGNALCAQCHQPARFDHIAHTQHAPDSTGSQCVACHMPKTTFMEVDDRHDHAFRIPRPDLNQTLGSPDACTACHEDRSPAWAAEQLAAWFPQSRHRGSHFGESLHAAQTGAPNSADRLMALINDSSRPAIVRASALRALTPWMNGTAATQVATQLSHADPLLRIAAIEALATLPAAQRADLVADRLADPILAVRLEAVSALAGEPERHLPNPTRAAFERALDEYITTLKFNADRPDTLVSLGDLHQRRGLFASADTAYLDALKLDPGFTTGYLHRADSARARGDETQVEAILRSGLAHQPDAAELHHALGLSLIRQRRNANALEHLQRAADLAPALPRYTYVYAIALNDRGQSTQARTRLTHALQRHPDDPDLLHTLAIYELEAGHRESARTLARRLLVLDSRHAGAHQLLQWIDRH